MVAHLPKSLMIWLAGVFAGLLAVGLGAVVVVEGGLFNATASTPHIPLVAVVTHQAFVRSVQVRAKAMKAPTAPFTPAQVAAGFGDYDGACAACHGGPGVARADWASGMTPTPPYLEDAARRWRAEELYWIVGQGVKMTAMPAWTETRTDAQLWDLVAFLEALPYLTAADYARMRAAAAGRGARQAGVNFSATPLSQ